MAGTEELKQAICDKFARDNDLNYETNQVMVSNGAKQIIFSAMMATLDPGDQVLITAPYFGCYRDIVLSVGGTATPLVCGPETNFRLTADKLRASITDKTRWLMLNLSLIHI